MIILWLVFIFYIFILIFRLWPTNEKIIWDKVPPFSLPITYNKTCLQNSDCKNTELCYNKQCVPKYRGAFECNLETGEWKPVLIKNQIYMKCECKYPKLITQNWVGGNCDVGIACGPYGYLERVDVNPIKFGRCICDPGYKSHNLNCVKILPFEEYKYRCAIDEINRKDAESIFHPDYFKNLSLSLNCFKKPCSFNVFNGKPLKNTFYKKGTGCVCNPSYGNFGIKFNNKSILNEEGYDACANIFEEEPNHLIDVKLYNYFYILDKDPISFIHFQRLHPNTIIPQLRNYITNKSLQISENWKYSYTQYIFRNEEFEVHIRKCKYETIFHIERCYENLIEPNWMEYCHKITNHIQNNVNLHINSYNLLYLFPVCYYQNNNDKKYFNTYILNPFLLSYEEFPNLIRSNGFVVSKISWDRWNVSLAETNFEKYKVNSQHPNLTTSKVTDMIAGNLFHYFDSVNVWTPK